MLLIVMQMDQGGWHMEINMINKINFKKIW